MKLQIYKPQCLLTLCFLLLLSMPSYADQWYQVELIVFEQLDTITDEQWPHMEKQQTASLLPNMATMQIQPATTKSLDHIVESLEASPQYQARYHRAWLQPIADKENALAINIHSANKLIEGSLKLYKAIYLHAALDLWLVQNVGITNSWSDVSPEGVDINAPRNPNLVESRRIRSKKLYFFDHPKMGAILQLTPVDTPQKVQSKLADLNTFSLPNEATPTVAE